MRTEIQGGVYTPVLQQAGGPLFLGSVSVSGARNVGGADYEVCVVSAAAEAWCFGTNSLQGQQGNGVIDPAGAPVAVPYPVKVLTAPDTPLTNVVSVSTTLTGSCALRNDGTVWCWGGQSAGAPALGDGTNATRAFAGPVLTAPNTPLTNILKVSAETNGSAAAGYCALNNASNVVCWGQQSSHSFTSATTPFPYATASILNNAGGPAFGPVSTFDYGWFAGYFVKAGTVYRLGSKFALGVSGGGDFPFPTLMTFNNGDPFDNVTDVTLGHGGTFNTGRALARKDDGSAWEIMNPVDGDILRFVKTGSNLPIVATQIGDGTALEADGSIWYAGGTTGTALRCSCMADAECGTAFPNSGANLPACIEDPASPKLGTCVRCDVNNTSACIGATPQCDPATNTCFGCTGNLGSAGAHPCNDPNAPFCRAGACKPCNGDFGSGSSEACGTAAAPACLPSGTCGQCSATNSSACGGGTPICDTASNTCAPCNGDFGSGNTAACGTAALPACLPNGTCGECSATNSTACSAAEPVCDTAVNTCAPCNGDLGSGATLECPLASSPTCSTSPGSVGTCGKCLTNLDCVGHVNGPICNVLSGACGTACTQDSDCAADKWCDNPTALAGAGTCTAKTPNGQPLPASPPINAICTTPNGSGARVCESAQCEPSDNLCGLANGTDCQAAANDGFCRSGICFDADTKCGLPNKEACTSDGLCRSNECFPADSLCGLPNDEACASDAVCRSNECFDADSKCGLPNSEACTTADVCRSAVCFATDSLCGLPNGEACSAPGVCRSGVCADGECGACATNADCSGATPICDTTTHVCVAEPDAGVPDAGPSDAGVDAGRDASISSSSSSSSSSSGGSSSGSNQADDAGYFDLSGGSCAAFVNGSGPAAPLGILAGLGLLLARRRRRG